MCVMDGRGKMEETVVVMVKIKLREERWGRTTSARDFSCPALQLSAPLTDNYLFETI